MSYSSRVYRQRNPRSHEESKEQPFFSKQHDVKKQGKKNTFFQSKLAVNKPGDSYEKEADSVANTVVNRSSDAPVVQQKETSNIQRATQEPEKEKKEVQKKEEPKKEEEKKVQKKEEPKKEEEKKVQKKEEPKKEEEKR